MSYKQSKLDDLFKRVTDKSNGILKRSLENSENALRSTIVAAKKTKLKNQNIIEKNVTKKINVQDLNHIAQRYKPFSLPTKQEFVGSSTLIKETMISNLQDTKWQSIINEEFQKPYMKKVFNFLEKEYKSLKTIYPPCSLVLNAFNLTPFDDIRVVLIGQDPYHNERQAHGLSFSVPQGTATPLSLKNIYNELKKDYPDFQKPNHGCLIPWALQGVFMLNASLTVEAHKANSHSKIGWHQFTDAVIQFISSNSEKGIVFLLWGAFAHKKEALIDEKRHCIIKTAHPSPLSYYRFKDSHCFLQVNEALVKLNRNSINWNCL